MQNMTTRSRLMIKTEVTNLVELSLQKQSKLWQSTLWSKWHISPLFFRKIYLFPMPMFPPQAAFLPYFPYFEFYFSFPLGYLSFFFPVFHFSFSYCITNGWCDIFHIPQFWYQSLETLYEFFLKFKSAGLKNVLAGYFSINHGNQQRINSINRVSLKKKISNFPNKCSTISSNLVQLSRRRRLHQFMSSRIITKVSGGDMSKKKVSLVWEKSKSSTVSPRISRCPAISC